MRVSLTITFLLVPILAGCGEPAPPGCEGGEGTVGCACRGGDQCDDGLFCQDGLCESLSETTVVVADADARSCEALLTERSGEVFDAQFVGTLGALVHEAPRVSLAFSQTVDSPFPDGAVRVRHSDGAELEVTRSQCFDREGRPLAGNPVSLR